MILHLSLKGAKRKFPVLITMNRQKARKYFQIRITERILFFLTTFFRNKKKVVKMVEEYKGNGSEPGVHGFRFPLKNLFRLPPVGHFFVNSFAYGEE